MNQNQRARKGFTLIEMLVVIAIIAVLVATVVPAVTSYANKAACATNAANLRAIQADVTMAYQRGDQTDYTFEETPSGINVTANKDLPRSKKTTLPECDEGEQMVIGFSPNPFEFIPKYDGLTAQDFADGAEGNYTPTEETP